MSLFVIVPFICFISIFFIFLEHLKRLRAQACVREAFLFASVAFGALIVLITEVLSIFKALTFAWVIGLWSAIALFSIIKLFFDFRKSGFSLPEALVIKKIPALPAFLLSYITFIMIISGITALVAAPNNWDSMLYHMARIPYWIQNQTVSYYPTHHLGYLWTNPFAEFSVLQLQLLSGGDRFANIVQWLSMFGSIIVVSLIAKRLGADLVGQVLAAFICATIPIGILQSASTQNNYVLGFWLAAFVYCVLVLIQDGGRPLHLLACGVSLGLAILTKSYAYFYALPFCIWLFISSGRKRFTYIFIIGFFALAINSGYFMRNLGLFGNPLGDSSGAKNYLLNEVFTIQSLASNIIRNAALHVGSSFSFLNGIMGGGIKFLHRILGMDMSDPRITSPGMKFYIPASAFDENITPNTAHFWLIITAILCFLFIRNLRKNMSVRGYLTAVISAFLLFCFFVKWQVHNTRLHLPLFVLFSAFAGSVFSNIRGKKFIILIAVFLIWASFFRLFLSKPRPWVGKDNIFNTPRIEQYFFERKWLQQSFIEISALIKSKGCRDIGLYYERPEWDYPFWVFLKQNSIEKVRIMHVNVENISLSRAGRSYFDFKPCAVIAVFKKETPEGRQKMVVNGENYTRRLISGPFQVFVKE